jgi:hypothetical protein
MTIQEGQDSIDQIDINMQIVGESSRSGGRERSQGPKPRQCSICSKTGYNARTYQEGIQATKN